MSCRLLSPSINAQFGRSTLLYSAYIHQNQAGPRFAVWTRRRVGCLQLLRRRGVLLALYHVSRSTLLLLEILVGHLPSPRTLVHTCAVTTRQIPKELKSRRSNVRKARLTPIRLTRSWNIVTADFVRPAKAATRSTLGVATF